MNDELQAASRQQASSGPASFKLEREEAQARVQCGTSCSDQPTTTKHSEFPLNLAEQQREQICLVSLINFIGCCVAWCFIYIDDVVV